MVEIRLSSSKKIYCTTFLLFTAMGRSRVADVSIPDVDLWTFLFERKSKPFLDDQGKTSRDLL